MKNLVMIGSGFAMLASAGVAATGSDEAATRAYVLTMPKILAYQKAGTALQNTADPAVRNEIPTLDGLMNGSNAEALAKLRMAPHVEKLLRQAGLTDADFVLIPEVLIMAGTAATLPASAAATMPVSAANVAFFKQHQAEIKALNLGNDG